MTETPMYPAGLCDMDVEVLRIRNGEDVEGWCAGAAFNTCCVYLQKRGFLDFGWTITDKGVALLKELGYA